MPTGTLPASGKKLWEKVYDESKDTDCDEECAARKAWAAVKNAGWYKNKDGEWNKKADLEEFSLRIERASFDKATNEMRWKAVASDTDEDSYNDNMSLDLFHNFLNRIQANTLVPENYRSDYWSGGMPYLSISHYSDLNGSGVPGNIETIYMDGSYLKSKGIFSDTELGRSCFKAVCDDLYGDGKDREDKVRISIAFLDYKHKHKSNGFVFERRRNEEWTGEICPECLKELVSGESQGKIFLDGHLIHLALTRVPANKRTSMEVERAMTTQREDATSIIGEELTNELDEKEKALVGKSEALVIKSDADEVANETTEAVVEIKSDAEEDDEEEEKCQDCNKPKSECTCKKEKADYDELKSMISEIKERMAVTNSPEAHVLDAAIMEFKSAFDVVYNSVDASENKLVAIQDSFNKFGEALQKTLSNQGAGNSLEEKTDYDRLDYANLAKTISDAIGNSLKPIAEKMELIAVQLSTYKPTVSGEQPPARRNIPAIDYNKLYSEQLRSQSETPKLRAIIERTTQ